MQATNVAPWFKELLAEHRPPCISIYLPTNRAPAPGNQTPVDFQNAVQELRGMIGGKQGYGQEQKLAALSRLEFVMNDADLWQGDREGLAFFVNPDHSHVIDLREPPE